MRNALTFRRSAFIFNTYQTGNQKCQTTSLSLQQEKMDLHSL